jgi:hypothetical protein
MFSAVSPLSIAKKTILPSGLLVKYFYSACGVILYACCVVTGVVVMEGFRIVFNRSSKTVGFAKSACGPAVGMFGPFKTKPGRVQFLFSYCVLCLLMWRILSSV